MQIRAKDLQIGYGQQIVVKAMDVAVQKGQITSIIGPNGSGKSTVLKALTKLLDYRQGTVHLNEEEIRKMTPKTFAKKIGVLPQKHDAPPDFKVKELIGFGRLPYQKWFEGPSKEDEMIIEDAMGLTGVTHLQDKSIHACSGGEAQRVWIATVLAQQPEILFLDEPTTYLDIAHQLETMRLVKKLNKETGVGIVMVLHDLAQALEVSDHIIVVKDGVKYAEGTPNEVITKKMMKEVYNVDCEILKVEGRKTPIIAYDEIA